MSKVRKNPTNNNILNKTFTPKTPRVTKQNIESSIDSLNKIQSSTETYKNNKLSNQKKKSSNNSIINSEKKEKPKTPKEILSFLLKNTLGKSLVKMESKTKEQMNTLKLVYKYFVVFDKNINLLKNGIEKKKKEDEKKLKLMESKKSKINTPLRIRSKTLQNLHKPERENSLMNLRNC